MDNNVKAIIDHFKHVPILQNMGMREKVIQKFLDREQKGFQKYGTTTERTDLTYLDWLNHLQDELMDACVYTQKLITLGRITNLVFLGILLHEIEKIEDEKTRSDSTVPKV